MKIKLKKILAGLMTFMLISQLSPINALAGLVIEGKYVVGAGGTVKRRSDTCWYLQRQTIKSSEYL